MAKILFIEGGFYIKAVNSMPANECWKAFNTGEFKSKYLAKKYLEILLKESKSGSARTGTDKTWWFQPKNITSFDKEISFRDYTIDDFFIEDTKDV